MLVLIFFPYSETSSRIVTIVLSAVLGGLIVVLISVAVFTIKLKKELKKVGEFITACKRKCDTTRSEISFPSVKF